VTAANLILPRRRRRVGDAPPPPPPTGDVPPPAFGIRESGTPGMADFQRWERRLGRRNLPELFRSDGERGSKQALATAFRRLNSQVAFYNFNPGRGAVNSNWPVCCGGTSVGERQAQLQDAVNGGYDAAWRASFKALKDRQLNWYVCCLAIEGQHSYYPWGTGSHNTEAGHENRNTLQALACRRFVRVAMEFMPHNWIFAWCPTLEAWRGNSSALNHFLANAYPGRQWIDCVAPTTYDAPWGSSCTDLPDDYSPQSIARRDARWRERWNRLSPWLNNFSQWCKTVAGDPATGWHELGVMSSIVGLDQAFDTGHENAPIRHAILNPTHAGGDNAFYLEQMWDWSRDPRNKCIMINHFCEQYRHDYAAGMYKASDAEPHSDRHPLVARYFKQRLLAEGPGDIRKNIAYVQARRPQGFGA
jgi:hypothetical protein